MKILNEKLALEALEYVLQFELDDFAENPSIEHVYYKAYAAIEGDDAALEILREALDDLNTELEY